MEILPAVEIETGPDVTASVIWLHGLGADGHDFEPIIPELKLGAAPGVRFVLPHAPTISITINGGMQMRAWFDILEHGERHIDVAQLLASTATVHQLIDREIERGVASEQIALVGFSQGGAVCLQAGLTYDKPLAGLLGLSTFFPTAEAVTPHPANASLPIQIFHGSQDPMLPEWMAENTIKYLKQLGYTPGYKSYPMTHSVCTEEIRDIGGWLRTILL
jgi:phospholipase/carboxylesterase